MKGRRGEGENERGEASGSTRCSDLFVKRGGVVDGTSAVRAEY